MDGMGGIPAAGVKIPRWLKRIEQVEYTRRPGWWGWLTRRGKPDIELDAALRESDRRLWLDGGYFAMGAVVELIDAWLRRGGRQSAGLSFWILYLPFVWIVLTDLVGAEDRWIGAIARRAGRPGGVGPAWMARQKVIRHRLRVRRITLWVFGLLFVAILPVTHALYHPHPGAISRYEVEQCEIAADFLAYAAFIVFFFRRLNRRCFHTVLEALYAAETQLASLHASIAGTVEDAVPSDAISWEITG